MNPLYCGAMNRLRWLDGWITPFLRLTVGIPKPNKLLEFLSRFTSAKMPVVVQLMGTDAELMAETAYELYQLNDNSNVRIAGFDLNCACPSRKVLKNGSGGTLLRSPQDMALMVSSIKKRLPEVPVEVKIRTGFDDHQEMHEIIPRLTDAGADLLHIHFRTVKEQYSAVEAGLDRLRTAVEVAGEVPVFGSGDIYSVDDAVKMVNETGCSGVLAARGLLKDPYLIQRIKGEGDVTADMRMYFFKTLLSTASKMPRQPGKGAFMEQAAWLFGPKDPFFRKISQMAVDELIALEL